MRSLHWLEDFNDRPPEPPPSAEDLQGDLFEAADTLPPPDPVAEAWNEGFLAGCRAGLRNARDDRGDALAELRRRVAAIEDRLQAIADQAAADIGGLLIDMLRHALPEDCPASVQERLNEAVEAVRPMFVIGPKFRIATEPPGEIAFHDLAGLYKVLEASHPPEWPVGVSWTTGGDAGKGIAALKAAIGKAAC
jgi:hypothetical protein